MPIGFQGFQSCGSTLLFTVRIKWHSLAPDSLRLRLSILYTYVSAKIQQVSIIVDSTWRSVSKGLLDVRADDDAVNICEAAEAYVGRTDRYREARRINVQGPLQVPTKDDRVARRQGSNNATLWRAEVGSRGNFQEVLQ